MIFDTKINLKLHTIFFVVRHKIVSFTLSFFEKLMLSVQRVCIFSCCTSWNLVIPAKLISFRWGSKEIPRERLVILHNKRKLFDTSFDWRSHCWVNQRSILNGGFSLVTSLIASSRNWRTYVMILYKFNTIKFLFIWKLE